MSYTNLDIDADLVAAGEVGEVPAVLMVRVSIHSHATHSLATLSMAGFASG